MHGFYSRLARFDLRFKYVIVFVWLVLTIVCVRAFPGIGAVVKNTESGFLPANSPSMAAATLLDPFQQSTLAAATLVAIRTNGPLTATDQESLNRLLTDIRQTKHVAIVRILGLSQDGQAEQVLVQANVSAYGGADGVTFVDAVRSEFTKVQAPLGLQFHFTGELPTAVDAQAASNHSQNATQLLSGLFIIVLLLLAYRSALAPLITLFPAGIVLALSSPVIAASTHFGVQVSAITQILLVVLILGAGTDYGVFLVFRVREEIRRGLGPDQAITKAIQTVGESITFSALIVIGALCCLVIARFGFYQGLGPALAIGIGLMLIAGLTLLPALLSIFGRAAFWPSNLQVREHPKVTTWAKLAGIAVKRPALTTIVGIVVFVGIAFGALGVGESGFADQTSGASGTDSAAGQTVLTKHFPTTGATISSTSVVMHFDSSVWNHLNDVTRAQQALIHSHAFSSVVGPLDPAGSNAPALSITQLLALHAHFGWPLATGSTSVQPPSGQGAAPTATSNAATAELQAYALLARFISPDGKTVQFAVIPAGSPAGSKAATANVPHLRTVVSAAATKASATASGLFSLDAFAYDVETISGSDLAHIIPLVALVIVLLLVIVLRSLVAPLYLAVSVLLSYFAAIGLVGIAFVRFGGQSGIQFILPFMMFVFLMALGSDYNVLVMTRIREEAHTFSDLKDAVKTAIGATGTTVTTAGLVLGGTFATLAISASGTSSSGQIQQIGFGIAAGILVDTFIVRTIVVPSVVVLVGRKSWWPSKLVHGEVEPAATPTASPP